MTEVAFIVPTLKPSSSDSSTSLRSAESSDSGQDVSSFVTTTSAQAQGGGAEGVPLHGSLPMHYSMQALREPQGSGVSESSIQAGETDKYTTIPMRGKLGSRTEIMSTETPRRRLPIPQDCAVMVVWLEKFEDHVNFPLETMSSILHGGSFMAFGGSHKPSLKRSLPVVFIHMLSTGLYQIATRAALSSRSACTLSFLPHLFVYLSAKPLCLTVYLSVCLSVCLSACLLVSLGMVDSVTIEMPSPGSQLFPTGKTLWQAL